MKTLHDIQAIMQMVKHKHQRHCTITYRNDGVWQTYIAQDNGQISHQTHPDLSAAYTRFAEFWMIDDVDMYDRTLLQSKVKDKYEELSDLKFDIEILEDKLKQWEEKV